MNSELVRHDLNVSNKQYFKIDDVRHVDMHANYPFIFSNDRLKKDGNVGKYYGIMPNFNTFIENRSKFPNCHEILISHEKLNKYDWINNGRLVFDFDITGNNMNNVPNDFIEQVEETIMEVISDNYKFLDFDILDFVWSSSNNPAKFSKHLTIKNLCFKDWIKMGKDFYKWFSYRWDSKYDWIPSSELIDSQIIRRNASLRMVGSCKLGKNNILTLDDDNFTLADSLIRVYDRNDRKKEQYVSYDNYIEMPEEEEDKHDKPRKNKNHKSNNGIDELFYEQKIYDIAIETFKDYDKNNVFDIGYIKGKFITLLRKSPGICFISNKEHENENAYLIISESKRGYYINFGCYRGCLKDSKKSININFIKKKQKREVPVREKVIMDYDKEYLKELRKKQMNRLSSKYSKTIRL